MKRKSCLALAFLLILLPLLGTFGTLGVSAENAAPEFRFSRLETMVTLNGVADAAEGWDALEWADLAQTGAWNTAPQEGFAGRFKAFWQTEGEQLYLCFLVEVNDDTVSTYSDWRGDAIWFNFDDGARFNTSTILIGQQAATTNAGTGNRTLSYAISDQRATTGTYTVEARYPVNTVGRFLFDILLQDNCMAAGESTNRYVRYAWGGLTQSGNALAGTGTLSGDLFGASYNGCNLYGTAAAMTLDGQVGENEAWNAAPWCGTFKQVSGSGIDGDHPAQAGFGAQFKALWQKDGDAAYLWFLVEVTDATVGYKANSWLADYFGIAIDENGDGTNELDTAAIYIPKRDGYDPARLEYKVDDRRAAGNGYTIEMKYTFSNAANCEGTIKFDLLLNDNIMSSDSDSNRYVRYSWKGITATGSSTSVSGIGTVAAEQLFRVTTRAGASIRIDTANPDRSGIRFATMTDTNAIDALVAQGATVTTGTLLLPTATLTDNGIADGNFTEAVLLSKGLSNGEDYAKIINKGNEWVTENGEQPGTWFGTLFNIRVFSRAFSAVGFVSVELANGTTYTIYGGYQASNSRSVASVATLAMEGEEPGDGGTYTAEQEIILQNFIEGGTP